MLEYAFFCRTLQFYGSPSPFICLWPDLLAGKTYHYISPEYHPDYRFETKIREKIGPNRKNGLIN